ncbi:olfactory receptor 5V1-like [Rhinatrema bivittatum]|uniref:olfactory receptor 5V1-like n=1 Tax=Rhinatrema bivittatum TaxID=194408 RepID=UPI00112EC7C1|nr:olfactory receptor 5V1-like [Rhinatrema bivittatum]
MENHTDVTEFLILGFSEFPELQFPLFVLFSVLYLIAVLGNLLIICIICADRHLHIPMYFFLANLSVLDISSLTVTVPKLLTILLTGNKTISFSECIIQMYWFLTGLGIEFLLLTAMAYDRYVAICNPLRYTIVMNRKVCVLLAVISWLTGFLEVIPHAIVTSQLSFCESKTINHIFCDLTALIKLSCTETSVIEMMTFAEGVFTAFTPFLLTLTSYVFIISTILKIRSKEGKSKAFSTCSSHLTVIILLYGSIIGVYNQPRSVDSTHENKLITVIYIIIIPLLNPLIYSLRSKELKAALRKVIRRKPY